MKNININIINILFNTFFLLSMIALNEYSIEGLSRFIISILLFIGGVSIIIINIIALSKKNSNINN